MKTRHWKKHPRLMKIDPADRLRAPLIVFSGVDGAGKSTQIERLADSLRQLGKSPVILWSRVGYTPGMERLKRLFRSTGSSLIPPSGNSTQRTATLARSDIRRWWIRLAILDLIWRFAVVIRVYQMFGKSVICDRYWEDSRIDIELHFPGESTAKYWLWNLLVRIAPKPKAQFLLLVPVDVYLRRSAEKNEPFPLTETQFQQRYQHYEAESVNPKWCVLDGRLPIRDIAGQIHNTLFADSRHAMADMQNA